MKHEIQELTEELNSSKKIEPILKKPVPEKNIEIEESKIIGRKKLPPPVPVNIPVVSLSPEKEKLQVNIHKQEVMDATQKQLTPQKIEPPQLINIVEKPNPVETAPKAEPIQPRNQTPLKLISVEDSDDEIEVERSPDSSEDEDIDLNKNGKANELTHNPISEINILDSSAKKLDNLNVVPINTTPIESLDLMDFSNIIEQETLKNQSPNVMDLKFTGDIGPPEQDDNKLPSDNFMNFQQSGLSNTNSEMFNPTYSNFDTNFEGYFTSMSNTNTPNFNQNYSSQPQANPSTADIWANFEDVLSSSPEQKKKQDEKPFEGLVTPMNVARPVDKPADQPANKFSVFDNLPKGDTDTMGNANNFMTGDSSDLMLNYQSGEQFQPTYKPAELMNPPQPSQQPKKDFNIDIDDLL